MQWWSDSSRDRLVAFGVGLGCGCLFLLLPPKVQTQTVTELKVVEKKVVEKRDVVKWRDRTVTIEKPGEKVTIVEKSGQEDKSKTSTQEKETTEKESKIQYFPRYSVGVSVSWPGDVVGDVGVRLGNLPLLLTGQVGSVNFKGEFKPHFGVGVRYEF